MVPLFVSLFEKSTRGVVACICADDEGLVWLHQEEDKRLQQLQLETLERSVSFWRPMQVMIRALSRLPLGELEHGVKGGGMMGIEADKILVVVGKTEECPELRDRAGLVPLLQARVPAEVTAPPAQAASPAAPPREGTADARGAETAAPASQAAAPTAAPGVPPTLGVALAQEPGASPRAAAAAEGSGEGARGDATAALASRASASAGHAAAPSTQQKPGTDPAWATGASQAAVAAAAVGREGAKYRTHTNPTETRTNPPKPFPPGRMRHIRPRRPSVRRSASRCRSCRGSGTPGA